RSRQVLMHYAVQDYTRSETQRILDELRDPNFQEVGLTVEEHRELANWAGLVDSDGDGIPDAEEVPRRLDPFDPDMDDDGIPDGKDSEPLVADTAAPQIAVAPLAGPHYAGDSLTLQVAVEDNGLIAAVELWRDGELLDSRS